MGTKALTEEYWLDKKAEAEKVIDELFDKMHKTRKDQEEIQKAQETIRAAQYYLNNFCNSAAPN